MKIVLINNLYPPYAIGGAERVVEDEARKLIAEGKEAVVITTRPWKGWGSWRPEAGKDNEVVVYRFFPPNIFWYKDLGKHNFFSKLLWHGLDIFNFASARVIREILEREKPDEVRTHNLIGTGCRNFKFQISNFKFRWVHYLHDVQLVDPSGVLPWNHEKDKLYQKIYSWLMKKRMGGPDTAVALSNFIENFYWSRGFFGGAKWSVTKISNFQFPISKQIPNSNIKFLFVGSLVEHKGIRVLMRAWEHVNSERSEESLFNASLHLVGDGVLLKEVDDWAKTQKNVTVHGRLEGEELEKIYQTCDILIFPSICLENRPTVILEALEHGLLIIASDTGGVRELVRPNDPLTNAQDRAWLFEPGNVEELVKRMKRFV